MQRAHNPRQVITWVHKREFSTDLQCIQLDVPRHAQLEESAELFGLVDQVLREVQMSDGGKCTEEARQLRIGRELYRAKVECMDVPGVDRNGMKHSRVQDKHLDFGRQIGRATDLKAKLWKVSKLA